MAAGRIPARPLYGHDGLPQFSGPCHSDRLEPIRRDARATGIDDSTAATEASWSAEACLARIEAGDRRVNAVVALDAENALAGARASAERRRSGRPRSPIDGMPLLVKANIAVAGLPWSAGIAAHRHRLAREDAVCVARLRTAGAIILGLTNMDEGALGASTDNVFFGRTDNPAAPGYSAGGSSGGSAAAVAAGFCVAALGTDTLGSVRIPASYCGVFGHKSGFGAIPTEGVVALSPTLDTVGVLGRSASICRMVTSIASGAALDPVASLPSVRLAMLDANALPGISRSIPQAWHETEVRARRAGLTVGTARLPLSGVQRLHKLLFMLAEIEGAAVHEDALRRDPAGFSPGFAALLAWGANDGARRGAAVRSEIRAIADDLRGAMEPFDALLTPTTTEPTFAADRPAPTDQAVLTAIASCLGWPATAFPLGVDDDGLPLSAQVVARDEGLCLAIADALAKPVAG